MICCTEKCIHQDNGICMLDHVTPITNTNPIGCEFYVEGTPCSKSGFENDNPTIKYY